LAIGNQTIKQLNSQNAHYLMNKAIFLDKDGTLLFNIPYNVDPELMILLDDVVEGLKKLQHKGFMLVVVSNQSGVALGYFEESELEVVKQKTEDLFLEHGLFLSGFYYCPHHPEGNVEEYSYPCNCRKPAPGMILRAAEELDIDLSQSWMAGDILNDVEAGNRAGCRTVIIDNGNETEWEINEKRVPDLIAKNINEAADLILIAEDILLPKNSEVSMLGFV
jgi:D,D-heptose 1,7-bisphosphate phosphatase